MICAINLSAQDCIPNVNLMAHLADTSNINQLDSLGKKQGVWIFTGTACNYGKGWNNDYTSKFDFCQVCAIGAFKDDVASDTVFYFNQQGILVRASIPFVSKDKPTLITYYESGNVHTEEYHYYHEKQKYWINQHTVVYSDSLPGCIVGKYLPDGTEISYVNCKMSSRRSAKFYNYYIKEVSESGSKEIQYAVEKGKFKNERLYNGFIYYYNEQDSLQRTVKVVDGKHLNDPTLVFKDKALAEQLVNHYPRIDIDYSGSIEQSEARLVYYLNLRCNELESKDELTCFENLKYLNDLTANISDPSPGLKRASDPSFVEFPEKPASFPGGETALKSYLETAKDYPQAAIENKEEGTVYISFVVEKDGSISTIDVLKSPAATLTTESIRLVKTMPLWIPAEQEGKAVRTKVTIPVKFVLPH